MRVVVDIVAFRFLRVGPFCCSDGLLQLIPSSLILHLVSSLEGLPPLPDFHFYVPIKIQFLVGEHTHSLGGAHMDVQQLMQ